jgi:putative intracellular protease/amidase
MVLPMRIAILLFKQVTALDEVSSPDIVLVPGGIGQQQHMLDGPVHEWLRGVDEHTRRLLTFKDVIF